MALSRTTRSCFRSKDKIIFRLFLLFILVIRSWDCAGIDIQKMAHNDPAALIAMEDSLSERGLSPVIIAALVTAHNTLGLAASETEDYKKAIGHFSSAVG